MFELARPWVLLFLIPLGVIVRWRLLAPGPTLLQALPRGWARDRPQRHRPPIPWFFRTAALIMFTIALAGPYTRLGYATPPGEGLAAMLVLDLSGSMATPDMGGVSRLDVARRELKRFIHQRPEDLLGLVTFARTAVTRVPATADHQSLLQVLDGLEVDAEADGTAIGTGLGLAAHRATQASSPSRVLILVTDGRNNSGSSDPLTVAEAAGALEVRIHTIGVGRSEMAEPPDEGLLREVSRVTGGTFFRATDSRGFRKVISSIEAMERGPVTRHASGGTRPIHTAFLWCGILLTLLESALWVLPGGRAL